MEAGTATSSVKPSDDEKRNDDMAKETNNSTSTAEPLQDDDATVVGFVAPVRSGIDQALSISVSTSSAFPNNANDSKTVDYTKMVAFDSNTAAYDRGEVLYNTGGQEIGKVMDLLGKGGMGEVYALQTPFGNTVAAKVIQLSNRSPLEIRDLTFGLVKESEVLIHIPDHVNIVRFIGVFAHRIAKKDRPKLNTCVLLSEIISGGSLTDYIQSGRLYRQCNGNNNNNNEMLAAGPLLKRLLSLSIMIGRGLQHLHDFNMLHEDMKPSNVLIVEAPESGSDSTPNQVQLIAKVTDFGTCQSLLKKHHVKRSQQTVAATVEKPSTVDESDVNQVEADSDSIYAEFMGGTPAYWSPEQESAYRNAASADTSQLSRTADIWTWALTVLEMFAGKRFWTKGMEALEALNRYLLSLSDESTSDPDLLRLNNTQKMPEQLSELLKRCFAKDVAQRPQSFHEILPSLTLLYEELFQEKFVFPESPPESDDNLSMIRSSAEGYMIRAHMELGQWNEAYDMCQKCLVKQPDNWIFLFTMGVLCIRHLNDLENAIKYFQRALDVCVGVEHMAERCLVLVSMTQVWIRQQNYDQALQITDEVLSVCNDKLAQLEQDTTVVPDPATVFNVKSIRNDALYTRAMVLSFKNRTNEAYEIILELVQRNADLVPVLSYLAASSGKVREAVQSLVAAIAKDPLNSELYSVVASMYSTMGDSNRAMEYIDKAAMIAPQDVQVKESRAMVWAMAGRLEDAYNELSEIAYGNRTANFYLCTAAVLTGMGKRLEAVETLREAVALYPTSASLKATLSMAFISSNQIAEAIEQAQMAINLDSTLIVARMSLGQSLTAAGRYLEAIESFEWIRKAQPNRLEAITGLVQAYVLKGDPEQALPLAQEAVQLQPNNFALHSSLVHIHVALGDMATAEQHARLSLSLNPNAMDMYMILPDLLAKMGKIDEAVATVEKAVEKFGHDIRLLHLMCRTYLSLGKINEALKLIEDGLKIDAAYQPLRCNYVSVLCHLRRLDDALKMFHVIFLDNPFAPEVAPLQMALLQAGVAFEMLTPPGWDLPTAPMRV
eukprot:GILJ01010528.1.p1 GENE.GILJ01010528.1~~GILJ01010528.1.p1  ORF type:complete len:1142 (-),score=229.55 GILJ01010528.1:71-3244(-)